MNKYEMKNVGDYLGDGCIFVQGDYCANDDGNKYGNGNWTYFADDGERTFHTCTVTHFAWRNSLGTAPTYTNIIEVKQRNGIVYVDYVKNIDFTLELSDNDVIQWKPYIECGLDWVLHKDRIFNKFGIISTDLYNNMMNISIAWEKLT